MLHTSPCPDVFISSCSFPLLSCSLIGSTHSGGSEPCVEKTVSISCVDHIISRKCEKKKFFKVSPRSPQKKPCIVDGNHFTCILSFVRNCERGRKSVPLLQQQRRVLKEKKKANIEKECKVRDRVHCCLI